MCRYCEQPVAPGESYARGVSVAIGIVDRERLNERRLREKYERALEKIANGSNGVKPLGDFEAQKIAQNALRRV